MLQYIKLCEFVETSNLENTARKKGRRPNIGFHALVRTRLRNNCTRISDYARRIPQDASSYFRPLATVNRGFFARAFSIACQLKWQSLINLNRMLRGRRLFTQPKSCTYAMSRDNRIGRIVRTLLFAWPALRSYRLSGQFFPSLWEEPAYPYPRGVPDHTKNKSRHVD